MNELDLTPGQYLAFILITLVLLAYELYRFYNDSEIIELPDKPQEEPAKQQLNPNYGAYIWLAGRRYN